MRSITNILFITLTFSTSLFSQTFTKLWEYYIDNSNSDGQLLYIGDINKDGKGEFLVEQGFNYSSGSYDTVFVIDNNKNILYDMSNKSIYAIFNSDRPHKLYDFNNDGTSDLFIRTSDGIAVYDFLNNNNLFSLSVKAFPGEANIYVNTIADIDGDGKLEILFEESKSGSSPWYSIFYLYSTNANVTSSINQNDDIPSNFVIQQNYPNPFNPTTTIEYTLPSYGNGHIEFYDSVGRLVRNINIESKSAGKYKYNFDARNSNGGILASGVYYYRVIFNGNADVKKMILLK